VDAKPWLVEVGRALRQVDLEAVLDKSLSVVH